MKIDVEDLREKSVEERLTILCDRNISINSNVDDMRENFNYDFTNVKIIGVFLVKSHKLVEFYPYMKYGLIKSSKYCTPAVMGALREIPNDRCSCGNTNIIHKIVVQSNDEFHIVGSSCAKLFTNSVILSKVKCVVCKKVNTDRRRMACMKCHKKSNTAWYHEMGIDDELYPKLGFMMNYSEYKKQLVKDRVRNNFKWGYGIIKNMNKFIRGNPTLNADVILSVIYWMYEYHNYIDKGCRIEEETLDEISEYV